MPQKPTPKKPATKKNLAKQYDDSVKKYNKDTKRHYANWDKKFSAGDHKGAAPHSDSLRRSSEKERHFESRRNHAQAEQIGRKALGDSISKYERKADSLMNAAQDAFGKAGRFKHGADLMNEAREAKTGSRNTSKPVKRLEKGSFSRKKGGK